MKIKPTATNPVDIACNINIYFPIKKQANQIGANLNTTSHTL